MTKQNPSPTVSPSDVLLSSSSRPKPDMEIKDKIYKYDGQVKLDDQFIHPVMCHLLGQNYSSFPNISHYMRMILRSLAVPVSYLIDSTNLTSSDRKAVIQEFQDSCRFLISLDENRDEAFDFVKFHTSSWFQKAVGDLCGPGQIHLPVPNKLPPSISSQPLFKGTLNRLVKRFIARSREGNLRARSVILSFHLTKLGCPELHSLKLLKSAKDHQVLYSTTPPPLSENSKEAILTSVSEVLSGDLPPLSKCMPSRSACVENSRAHGGAFSFLDEKLKFIPSTSDFESTVSKIGLLPALHQLEQNMKSVSFEWAIQEQFLRHQQSPVPPSVSKMQIIPEPGKFRVITAGSAELGVLAQPLQGSLLSAWSRTSYSTMSSDWIAKYISDLEDLPPHFLLFSGDYDAATDRLNLNSSTLALGEVMRRYNILTDFSIGIGKMRVDYPIDSLRQIAESSPEGIRQECLEIVNSLQSSILQCNGQLMGHPLSFPLLCMINLAGFNLAMLLCIEEGSISESDAVIIRRTLRINGDDIGFAAPEAFVRKFEYTSSLVGFKLTLGKSYVSPSFLMINNVFFSRVGSSFKRFSYLNQRLIFNVNIKKGDAPETPLQIGHAFNDMFEYCPGSHRYLPDAVLKRSKGFPIKGFSPNFFIPCALGGLGVNPKFASSSLESDECDGKFNFTRPQRLVAALCSEDQLASSLVSQGRNPLDPLIRKYASRLGIPRMANSEVGQSRSQIQFSVPDSFSDLPLAFQVLSSGRPVFVRDEENLKNFQHWLSLVNLLNTCEKTPHDRRLNLNKLGKLKPMSTRKLREYCESDIRSLQPSFPLLPPKGPSSFIAHYPSLRPESYRPSIFKIRKPEAIPAPYREIGWFDWSEESGDEKVTEMKVEKSFFYRLATNKNDGVVSSHPLTRLTRLFSQ